MILPHRNRSFTLIETLVCLVLLTMVGTFATIRGYDILQEFRHNNSCKRLHDELLLTRVLSNSYQMDIHLELIQKKNHKVALIRRADFPNVKIRTHFDRPILLQNLTLIENKTLDFYPSVWKGPIDVSTLVTNEK